MYSLKLTTLARVVKPRPSTAMTLAAAFITLPMIANADPGHTGPPMAYGQWNATLDAITGKSVVNDTSAECVATGWTCKTIAEDDGFLYQEIRTPDGETYTRMINLDPGSAGDASTLGYSSESYTARQERNNNNDWTFADDDSLALAAQGLAARQIIRDGAMETTVELQNGYARGLMGTNSGVSTPSDPIDAYCSSVPTNTTQALIDACAKDLAEKGWNVKIMQAIHDAEIDADFSTILYYDTPSSFGVSSVQTTDLRGKIMDIAQSVTDTLSGGQEKFDIRKRQGRSGYEWWCPWVWPSGFTCNPQYDLTTGGSITLDGTTKTWNAQDFVRAAWIGSTMGSDAGFMLTTANTIDSNGAGSGEAREVLINTTPTSPDASWLAGDPFYDLNWPVKVTNIPDPFAGHGTSARTAPPAF